MEQGELNCQEATVVESAGKNKKASIQRPVCIMPKIHIMLSEKENRKFTSAQLP